MILISYSKWFWPGTYSLCFLANTAAWLGTPRLLNRHAYLACFLPGFSIMTVYWVLIYLVWTQLLDLPYPIPLIGAQASALWTSTYPNIRACLGKSFNLKRQNNNLQLKPVLEKPLIQHRLVVPDPECLAQGISDGGGGCGCRHLVPVSSLMAQ